MFIEITIDKNAGSPAYNHMTGMPRKSPYRPQLVKILINARLIECCSPCVNDNGNFLLVEMAASHPDVINFYYCVDSYDEIKEKLMTITTTFEVEGAL